MIRLSQEGGSGRQHAEQHQLLGRGLREAAEDGGLCLARSAAWSWKKAGLQCLSLSNGLWESWEMVFRVPEAVISNNEKFGLTAGRTAASCPESSHSQAGQAAKPCWRGRLWKVWWTQRDRSDTLGGEHGASLAGPNSLAPKGRSVPHAASWPGASPVGAVLGEEPAVSQTLGLLFIHCCCSAERDFFAQDHDGNMRRIVCILPTFYMHIHSWYNANSFFLIVSPCL